MQGCNRGVVDPVLDGPCEFVEFGKDRTDMAGSRPFAPRGRHVCTPSARMSATGDDSKELSPRRKRSMIALPARASGHRHPKGLVSRKVSRVSGRSFMYEKGAASGASDTPDFPPMFRDRARGAFAHADRRTLDIFAAPCPADQFSGPARRIDERHRKSSS